MGRTLYSGDGNSIEINQTQIAQYHSLTPSP